MVVVIICLYLIIGAVIADVLGKNSFFASCPAGKFEYYAVALGYPFLILCVIIITIKLIVTKR